MIRTAILVLALCSTLLSAATMPTGLRSSEVERLVDTLGIGAQTRLLRAAEPYDSFPGFKMGLEFLILPMRDLSELGNRDGSLPSINPIPRIYLAKGLFWDLDLIFSFFPTSLAQTTSTYGGFLKWTVQKEDENWLSTALFLGFSSISAVKAFNANNVEIGANFSKDYVRLKPYIGASVIVSRGTVESSYVSGSSNSSFRSALHIFVGGEIQTPVDLAFQVDLMNLSPSGTIFIGKKF